MRPHRLNQCSPGGWPLHPPREAPPRDWCLIAEQPAPAPHLAHPEGCAALRIVRVPVPRVSRSCEYCQDGIDFYLLPGSRLKGYKDYFEAELIIALDVYRPLPPNIRGIRDK